MLRRRRAEFHGAGRFTRYRYPVKFHHQQPLNPAGGSRSGTDVTRAPLNSGYLHALNLLPASLRTTTRYGQEPTVQSTGQANVLSSRLVASRSFKTG